MQLKRLRRKAATIGQNGLSTELQELTASQLLEDLEQLAHGSIFDAAQVFDEVKVQAEETGHMTPAVGTRNSLGPFSSAKRRRREFKPLFDGQDDSAEQQGALGTSGTGMQRKEADDVDLVTPPWLQKTKPCVNSPATQGVTNSTANAAGNAGGTTTMGDITNSRAAQQATGHNDGWRFGKGVGPRAVAQPQQQEQMQLGMMLPGSGQKQRPHHQAPGCSQLTSSAGLHQYDAEEEDAISDSDTEGATITPAAASAARAAAAARQQLQRSSVKPAAMSFVNPTGISNPQQYYQQQQLESSPLPEQTGAWQQHTPGSSIPCIRNQQQQQQNQQQQQLHHHQQGNGAAAAPLTNTGTWDGVGASNGDAANEWQPPKKRLQHQVQQQPGQFTTPDTSQIPRHVAGYETSVAPPPAMPSRGAAAGRLNTSILESNVDDADADIWQPPKNRRQQVQLPLSASKPPAAPRMQQVLSSSGHEGREASGSDVAGFGVSVEASILGAAAAAATEACGEPPWWMILEDFVPVEVLVQKQCNPRDNTIVHINYKSQFKDGGAAGRRASTAGDAPSSKKRATGGSTGRKSAATAAAGGFSSAGAEFLASLGSRKAAGKKGSSGGRKGSRASGGKRGRGSGGSSRAGSGGQKKKGRRRNGRWTYIDGRKVFVDASGNHLTGSAAWKAYKG